MEEHKNLEREDLFNTDTFCKVIILNHAALKFKDLESFMLLIKIWNINLNRASSDLGVGINQLTLPTL